MHPLALMEVHQKRPKSVTLNSSGAQITAVVRSVSKDERPHGRVHAVVLLDQATEKLKNRRLRVRDSSWAHTLDYLKRNRVWRDDLLDPANCSSRIFIRKIVEKHGHSELISFRLGAKGNHRVLSKSAEGSLKSPELSLLDRILDVLENLA